jgi:glycosidase
MIQINKTVTIALLLIAVILFSGCAGKPKVTMTQPGTSTPGVNATPSAIRMQTGGSWLYEGTIYETHPYYYPKHSFKEITEQVPSLADLGVRTIYLMPIWEQPPGEQTPSLIYHIYDYYKVNPEYGTSQDLKDLISAAHKNNIKVLFDLVTCCTWKGSTLYNNGGTYGIPLTEIQNKAKEIGWKLDYKTVNGDNYVSYGCIEKPGKRLCEFGGMIVNDKVIVLQYPQVGWGFAIDKTSPVALDYFTKMTKFYVNEYNIDGWRVDAPTNNWNSEMISGDHSSQQLLRSVKSEITKAKPDALLISEWPTIATIEPSKPITTSELDEENDASYSYYFYYQLSNIFQNRKLLDVLGTEKISFSRTRIRFLETHDINPRINKLYPQLNEPLTVLISTIPGIPMIQAGQEIGAGGEFFTNPQVDWINGDSELRNFYKKVFEIRNNNNALKYGSMTNVWKSGSNIYCYLRSYQNENAFIMINFMDTDATAKFDVSFLNKGTILYDVLNGEQFIINDPNNLEISVPARGSRILTLNK